MVKDINTLIDSLKAKNFLEDASVEKFATFIENVIAPSYRSGLFRANGIVEHKIEDYRELVEEVLTNIINQYKNTEDY